MLTLNGTSLNGIQPGVNVLVDIGPILGATPPGITPTAEVATVQSVTPYNPAGPTPPTITLNLALGHYNTATNPLTITYPAPVTGNPGPQPNFNMRQVPWAVRYFSIIN